MIDSDMFRLEGYFEETKLRRIKLILVEFGALVAGADDRPAL